jgi:hypothetical protein
MPDYEDLIDQLLEVRNLYPHERRRLAMLKASMDLDDYDREFIDELVENHL